jgi:hypothetical protein
LDDSRQGFDIVDDPRHQVAASNFERELGTA